MIVRGVTEAGHGRRVHAALRQYLRRMAVAVARLVSGGNPRTLCRTMFVLLRPAVEARQPLRGTVRGTNGGFCGAFRLLQRSVAWLLILVEAVDDDERRPSNLVAPARYALRERFDHWLS
jgi:hypothetical protein